MLPQAIENLEKTRDLLLRESQEAGAKGDWNMARKLIDLAEQADQLRIAVQHLSAGLSSIVEPMPVLPPPPPSPQPAPAQTQDVYPRFFVREDVLVKRGRQRDGANEYEHTVPKDRFDRIIRIICGLAAGRRTNPQKPLKFEMVQEDLDYPQYQARVIVSLLVRKGLLVVARKGSYRFRSPTTFDSDVASLWNTLKGENG